MSFKLSTNTDTNKVFLVNYSELYGRFDPHFHKPEFKTIEKKVKDCEWQKFRLIDLFDICRGGSPRPIQNYLTEDDNGLNWLKIGDTKGIDKYIYKTKQKIKPEGAKYSRKVIEGDLILSNSMSFGKPFILRTTAYIHDGWLLFRCISNEVSKDYLHTVLGANFVYKLFKKQTIGGVVENLNIDLVKNIRIPIPPKEIQAQIVSKIDEAYAIKKLREIEIQDLIDSVDDYLLSELGIDLPKTQENIIQKRVFYRNLSEVSGGRFDSEYYHLSHYQDLVNLKESQFNLKKLADVCTRIVDGPFGSSIKAKDYVEKGIPFIRVADVTKGEGYLKTDELIFISEEAHQKILRSRVIPTDVVIAKTGATMGAACVVPETIPEANIRGDLAALTVKSDECLPEYVVAFINTKIGQRLFWRLDSGGTRGRVVIGNLEKLPIVVPPLEVQKNIVQRVDAIRDRAKQLRQEAEADLEKAKQEVEAMILGVE